MRTEYMTQEELERIKADIKSEIIKEITGKDYKHKRDGMLDAVRKQYMKPLYDRYGTYHFDQVWNNIRRLACYMSGVKYVRDLIPSKEAKAAEVAERLCKMAIGEDEDKC